MVDVRLVEKVPEGGRQGAGGGGGAADRVARRRQGRHGLPVGRDEGCRARRARVRGSDIVAGVPDPGDNGELTRLRAEVALLRDELATARAAEEKFEIRLAKMRAARDLAESSANVLSRALADRLRIDGTDQGRKRSLLARRQPGPTAEEQQQLELIRSSPLFDAAWYLRNYHDVVQAPATSRACTSCAIPPGPPGRRARTSTPPATSMPIRRCSRRASTRWCTSCSARRARGPTATRRSRDDRTSSRSTPTALRGLPGRVGSPSSSDGGASTGEDPARARRLVSRSCRGPARDRQAAPSRPRRPAPVRHGGGRAAASCGTRRGTPRPTGSPPAVPRPAAALRRRGLARPARAQPRLRPVVVHLQLPRPTAEEVNPLLHYLLVGRHDGLEPVPGPRPACVRRPGTPRGNGRAARCLFAGYDRDGIIDDYVVALPARAGPARRRLLPRRRRARARRARQARRASPPGPGASRTRPTTSAPGRCWPATSWAGTGSTATTRWSSPTTAASWCGPSTTCFARDGRSRLRLVEPAGDLDGVQRGRRRRRRLDAARRRPARELIGPRRWSDVHYLHLSSYFQVLRRPVLDDPGFRFRLDTVCGQRTKQLVVDKYEIGIGRYLMDSGYRVRDLGRRALPVPPALLASAPSTTSRPASRWSSATSSPRTRATCRASAPGRSGCSPRRPTRRST